MEIGRVELVPHPADARAETLRLTALPRRLDGGRLTVSYRLEGPLADLHVPPPRPARVVHGLWRHTCFEVFIALDNAPGYHELNFAPSGEWALYAFRSYREIAPLPDETVAPQMHVRCLADRLEPMRSCASTAYQPFTPLHRFASHCPR